MRGKDMAKKTQIKSSMKGQASLFDGITFLLLATLASGIVFSQAGGFGVEEGKVIRSAYVLNYMQMVVKTVYYLDASTLQFVTPEGLLAYNDLAGECSKLRDYPGNVGVADLMKRDLTEQVPRFDDLFEGSNVLGKTSARCAMKELMKPFAFAGYNYLVEVLDANLADQVNHPAGAPVIGSVTPPDRKVTNQVLQATGFKLNDCDEVSRMVADSQAVAVPFQIVYTVNSPSGGISQSTRYYKLRFCIWPEA